MRKKRTTESMKDRSQRVEKNAQEVREASGREDAEIDAMVQKSVRLYGAELQSFCRRQALMAAPTTSGCCQLDPDSCAPIVRLIAPAHPTSVRLQMRAVPKPTARRSAHQSTEPVGLCC